MAQALVIKYKPFVEAEMADSTKKTKKSLKKGEQEEEEEQGDSSQLLQDKNLLEGDVSSPFAQVESDESAEEEIAEP